MTPTLIAIQERHKAFHSKIAAQAKPDTGISCPSAIGRIPANDPAPPVIPSSEEIVRWTERQRAIPIPVSKEPWFSIVEETDTLQVPVSIRDIQIATCEHFRISLAAIAGPRRFSDLAFIRQVGMYLCTALTERPMTEIGRKFGGRDHSTIHHARRKIGALRSSSPDLESRLHQIARAVGAELP